LASYAIIPNFVSNCTWISPLMKWGATRTDWTNSHGVEWKGCGRVWFSSQL